jgi:2-C-methyl-D-erythritol 2,4-cyclodiphosphate synthase
MKRVVRKRAAPRLSELPKPRRNLRGIRNPQSRIHNSQSIVPNSHRVGIGNDLHRLAPGRKLILGGVKIPSARGPVGHSDADALIHAICDALLGAAALGDIGRHFPDTASEWRDASSLIFLRHIGKLLDEAGYKIINIDSTVGLERPKLVPHIPRMVKKIAAALRLRPGQVSVKAKTGEGLGAIGQGVAVRADAVALIHAV